MKESARCKITNELTVEYTLSSEEGENSYSILCEIFSSNGKLLDSERAEHFTSDYKTAKGLYNTIVKHQVTPCTLNDVIEDLSIC